MISLVRVVPETDAPGAGRPIAFPDVAAWATRGVVEPVLIVDSAPSHSRRCHLAAPCLTGPADEPVILRGARAAGIPYRLPARVVHLAEAPALDHLVAATHPTVLCWCGLHPPRVWEGSVAAPTNDQPSRVEVALANHRWADHDVVEEAPQDDGGTDTLYRPSARGFLEIDPVPFGRWT